MATTAGGIGVLVVVGLMAVGYSEAGWGSAGTTAQAGDVDEGTATCDGVLVVETGSGSVSVPGDVSRADGEPSTACRIPMDQGDEAAVTAVQQALVSCHGQSVTVDGSYGARDGDSRDGGAAAGWGRTRRRVRPGHHGRHALAGRRCRAVRRARGHRRDRLRGRHAARDRLILRVGWIVRADAGYRSGTMTP